MGMRILGIDPGVATVGFGVIDAVPGKNAYVTCGIISTPKEYSLAQRLDIIYRDTKELIEAFHPEVISMEELFFSKNITTGISVAHGRGVSLLAAYQCGIPVFEYTPMQVKQAVTGYGKAEKKQVIFMVQRLLNMKSAPKPDDAADALAMAICHARSHTSKLTTEGGANPCFTI